MEQERVGALILDGMIAPAWFADRDKVIRYVNLAAKDEDVAKKLGQSIEGCHKPDSIAKVRQLYDKWSAGGTDIRVSRRDLGDRKAYNILIPVHGPDGFKGVLELAFKADA